MLRLGMVLLLCLLVIFPNLSGCSGDKYQLGLQRERTEIDRIVTWIDGTVSVNASVGINAHQIIEARPYNELGEFPENHSLSMVSNDEAVMTVPTVYRSGDSYFAIVKGIEAGQADLVVSGGRAVVPVRFNIGTGGAATPLPYLKFVNASTTPLGINATREFAAEFVNSSGQTEAVSLVWSLSKQGIATLGTAVDNRMPVTGTAAGSVELLVRDANNKASAGLSLIVQ